MRAAFDDFEEVAREAADQAFHGTGFDQDGGDESTAWPEPDMSLAQPHVHPAPAWPDDVLPEFWARWVAETAEGAAIHPDLAFAEAGGVEEGVGRSWQVEGGAIEAGTGASSAL